MSARQHFYLSKQSAWGHKQWQYDLIIVSLAKRINIAHGLKIFTQHRYTGEHITGRVETRRWRSTIAVYAIIALLETKWHSISVTYIGIISWSVLLFAYPSFTFDGPVWSLFQFQCHDCSTWISLSIGRSILRPYKKYPLKKEKVHIACPGTLFLAMRKIPKECPYMLCIV